MFKKLMNLGEGYICVHCPIFSLTFFSFQLKNRWKSPIFKKMAIVMNESNPSTPQTCRSCVRCCPSVGRARPAGCSVPCPLTAQDTLLPLTALPPLLDARVSADSVTCHLPQPRLQCQAQRWAHSDRTRPFPGPTGTIAPDLKGAPGLFDSQISFLLLLQC